MRAAGPSGNCSGLAFGYVLLTTMRATKFPQRHHVGPGSSNWPWLPLPGCHAFHSSVAGLSIMTPARRSMRTRPAVADLTGASPTLPASPRQPNGLDGCVRSRRDHKQYLATRTSVLPWSETTMASWHEPGMTRRGEPAARYPQQSWLPSPLWWSPVSTPATDEGAVNAGRGRRAAMVNATGRCGIGGSAAKRAAAFVARLSHGCDATPLCSG